jgi:hypothetical protein
MKEMKELHKRLIEMSKRQLGYGSDEVPGYSVEEVGRATCDLKRWGHVYGGKRGHRTVRYFATATAAAEWVEAGIRCPTVKIGTMKAPWSVSAEPLFTEKTKYTYGRSPKEPVLRSNTYGQW